MRSSERLVESLYKHGVRRVFGIPGGSSIPYMEAMRNRGIDFTLVSNEQSAAIMADISYRLTGVAGVCHATFGPGATNLLTGIGGAYLDRSAVIALTVEVGEQDIGRNVQMNIDHQAVYKPVTKYSTRISPKTIDATIDNAFDMATAEVPGPVHIGIPADIADIQSEQVANITQNNAFSLKSLHNGGKLGSHSDTSNASAYGHGDFFSEKQELLSAAQQLLLNTKRPIIAIGLSALRHGLYEAIREFVDKNNIPVITTPMAKGAISEKHPNFAGVLFHACSEVVADIYRSADLVLALGYDPVEFNYETWMPNVPLIHIDSMPADILAGYTSVINIIGDPSESVKHLCALDLPRYSWIYAQITSCRSRLQSIFTAESVNFGITSLLQSLMSFMPENGIVTCDVGAHLHVMGQFWDVTEPNRLLMTNGWSAMGFGIPAAIGAKLCKPNNPVVCVTGDGGFLMNCGELLTARRLKLDIIIIVLCDRDLSLISLKQNRKNLMPYGTALYDGSFFDADCFFGVPVFKAKSDRELNCALKKASSVSGPAIIQADIDSASYERLITREYK